jgi:hypothetical protein
LFIGPTVALPPALRIGTFRSIVAAIAIGFGMPLLICIVFYVIACIASRKTVASETGEEGGSCAS